MKKSIITGVALGALAFAGISVSTTTHADAASWLTGTKTTVLNVQMNGDADSYKLFTTSIASGKNAYVWNNAHTKHVHNLKNYRHTTWYASKKIVKNKQTYYVIKNQSGSAQGLVWGGYLRAYVRKTANQFKTAAAFENFINTDPSQKLSRAILKQLNGIPMSYELSKYAAGRFADFPTSIDGFEDIIPLSTYELPVADFNAINPNVTWGKTSQGTSLYYYWEVTYGRTVASRTAKINTVMADHGLKLSDYNGAETKWRIGLYIDDTGGVSSLILAKATN